MSLVAVLRSLPRTGSLTGVDKMINAIFFGAFALILGLWGAALIGDDSDKTPIAIRLVVVLLVIGGFIFAIVGLSMWGLSYV